MNGFDTIKQVRVELCEATILANTGQKATAAAAMGAARRLLETYCKTERGPEHGFEKRGSKRKRKSG